MLNSCWRSLFAGAAVIALMSGPALAEAEDVTAPDSTETVEGPVNDDGMVSIDFGLETGGEVVSGEDGTGEETPTDYEDPQTRGPEDCENCRGDDGVTDGTEETGTEEGTEYSETDYTDPEYTETDYTGTEEDGTDMEVTAYDGSLTDDEQTLSDVPEAMQSGIPQPRGGKSDQGATSFSGGGNSGKGCAYQRHTARCID